MISKKTVTVVSLVVSHLFNLALTQNGISLNSDESCECMFRHQCKINTNSTSRLGRGRCAHYLHVCCPIISKTPTGKAEVTRPVPRGVTCGIAMGVALRVPIVQANYGEFPWTVALMQKLDAGRSMVVCGGSIIHPLVVLTAAHCLKPKKNLFVRAGDWDIQRLDEMYPHQDRDIKQVIIHEGYYGGAYWNDVALLILENRLQFNAVVSPVCVPPENEITDNRECTITGWTKGTESTVFKKIDVPIVPRETCQSDLRTTMLGENFTLHESFLCAAGQEGSDACKIVGGSALICESKSNPLQYFQVGVASCGLPCGTDSPIMYASVPYFQKWINDRLENVTSILDAADVRINTVEEPLDFV